MQTNLAVLKPEAPLILLPGKWNKKALSLLGRLSDQEVSRLTGKKLKTVKRMRYQLGIKRAKCPSLSDSQEIQIRAEYALGRVNQYELAAKYSIDQGTVSRVVNRWRGKRDRDCADLTSETLEALALVWEESCANGSQDFFGIWTKPVNVGHQITWRDLQSRREGVLCTTACWQDMDVIALAVWHRLKKLSASQKSFKFADQRIA